MDGFTQFALAPVSLAASNFVIQMNNKEVLRITADGELIFANASEAASALLEQWDRVRGVAEPIGQFQGAPADPEAFG